MNSIQMTPLMTVIVGVLAVATAVAVVLFILVPILKGVSWLVAHLFRFAGAMVGDVFRLVGGVITTAVMSPLAVFNLVAGRWSAAQHYGRSIQGEVKGLGATLYRLVIGHPARLFCMKNMVEGLEQRVPAAMANVPPPTRAGGGGLKGTVVLGVNRPGLMAGVIAGVRGKDGPGGRASFPGYEIVGTLPGGGSGSQLYVCRPDAAKLAAFERMGFGAVGDVVIKCFMLSGGEAKGDGPGSTLPQIVRESRALEAAKRLGLVLEHELNAERFFYVMRYVPGDSLSLVTQRLHAASPTSGLEGQPLAEGLSLLADLVSTLAEYHGAGLWHKDVKPDNIIVAGGRAHLVDFGLVTPLRSSMTLTTHGTEYFRDPELVRMALRGVKVHEVDGAKFDVYGAGAVMYSLIENSFPAHGGLSQITKACPEAVRWVVRRAMTEYDKRYPTAAAMLADLRVVVQAARDGRLAGLRPADLPSVRDGGANADAGAAVAGAAVAGAAGVGAGVFAHDPVYGGSPPPIRPGAYPPPLPGSPVPPPVGRFGGAEGAKVHAAGSPRVRSNKTAAEQLQSARARVEERRRRAASRLTRSAKASTGVNWGLGGAAIAVAGVVFVGTMIAAFGGGGGGSGTRITVESDSIEGAQEALDKLAAETALASTRLVVDGVPAPADASKAPDAPTPPKMDRASRRAKAKAKPVETVVAADAGKGVRVLVVQEPAAFEEGVLNGLRLGYSRLTGHGFELLGSSVEPPAASEDLSEEQRSRNALTDRLTAELRSAVGLNPIPGDAARDMVGAWLAKTDGVEAVMWIARQTDDSEDQGAANCVRWLVVGPRLQAAQAGALEKLLRGGK